MKTVVEVCAHEKHSGRTSVPALTAVLALPSDLLTHHEPTRGLDPLLEAVFDQEVARVIALASVAASVILDCRHKLTQG
ncbi:hypothetical protein B7R25_04270 [Subtercola boreus]|uniref:Uncharacterized protein n=2 Tax=Subtercola boreus TaxID=120213 RepID=A0A3E0WC89_9MICO|nr:hypothetical protein B7R24_04260 [Subtercola boreus]RFA22426.1 hypothetical protein B7R23_04255 [Subtercola boreus]RFA28441.1 hypothetical protein B7R25_04270 [Subtercola boreus]